MLPTVILSTFTSYYIFYRIVTLGIGVGFFGSIFLRNSYGWLKHKMERYVACSNINLITLTVD